MFDSLNYIENMKLGIDAVGQAGGIVEGAVCYTGDVSDPKRGLYDLEYYLNFVRELEASGIHVLAIKGKQYCHFFTYRVYLILILIPFHSHLYYHNRHGWIIETKRGYPTSWCHSRRVPEPSNSCAYS